MDIHKHIWNSVIEAFQVEAPGYTTADRVRNNINPSLLNHIITSKVELYLYPENPSRQFRSLTEDAKPLCLPAYSTSVGEM